MKPPAPFTSRLSPSTLKSGTLLRPSEPVAAPPSIQTELGCSPQTTAALLAILDGLLAEVLSEDKIFLAMMRAWRRAQAAGVPAEEFQRVQSIALRQWNAHFQQNPLKSLFR